MRPIFSALFAHSALLQALHAAARRPVARSSLAPPHLRTARSAPKDAAGVSTTSLAAEEDQGSRTVDPSSSSSSPSSEPSSSNQTASGSAGQASQTSATSEGGSIVNKKNPFDDIFSGDDPFPRAATEPRWLTDSMDRGRDRRGRGKETVPRSVLFTPENDSRGHRQPPPRRGRGTYDRTPLSRSEADAFASLLHSALDVNISSNSSTTTGDNLFGPRNEGKPQPFGAYTDLISHESPREKTRYQLEAYLSRNRLRPRFEESRMARARKSAREGLAAQVSQAQLDAGIDEAREELSMCENEFEVWEWAKKEVWGLGSSFDALLPLSMQTQQGVGRSAKAQPTSEVSDSTPEGAATDATTTEDSPSNIEDAEDASLVSSEPSGQDLAATESSTGTADSKPPPPPRFGKETPYFAPVLHLVFLTLRDRYRSPHSALAVYDLTRSLGIESYVLGCTAALFADLLRTRWDHLVDLESCRTLLRQARETGVLSDPASRRRELLRIKRQRKRGPHDPIMTPEDEKIREVVDRIRAEARKEVLQQVQSQKVDEVIDVFAHLDLGREEAADQTTLQESNWAQKHTLDLADELGKLAGPPSRVILGM
ncbi:uncharacterized protein PFL1_06485 [Pseudozyma flocculosa PF-1]|uniref:Mtf2-like C-terminal domain-containing protein n=2 Tax=Pseudozyma flocculosa TaxID=84751 RepID=A0A5C3EUY7_9BASI|nr:uncharacterized protein PFL1_06485 [Pseudozyma flocculosa PF-1]EPQ26032.1 hypothetical protein PFL1_06485 [Pseudozyma flocculosa PF-1]SPO35660.1 uncharacterized protein PSFLO_01131 [Pseudozyma flocculosa]